MKKYITLFLIMVAQAWGVILELDKENADLNLTSTVTVLTDTPDGTYPMVCQAYIVFGDGTKNLDGTGGVFEFVITVGGYTIQPSPEVITFGTDPNSAVWTSQFVVPENTEVILRVKSPNADTDVDVTAWLYDIFPVSVTSGVVQADLADGITHGGSTAVLTLKTFTVSNPDGDAVTYESTGSNGNGHVITGHNTGHGVLVTGNDGYRIIASGEGFSVSAGGDGFAIVAGNDGISITATAPSGAGIDVISAGIGLRLIGDGVSISAVEIDAIQASLDAQSTAAEWLGLLSAVDTDATSATHAPAYVTLEAGKASNDAYNGMSIAVTDATDSNTETRRIEDYTSGRKVTFDRALSFTPVQNDIIRIYSMPYNVTAAIAGGSANTYIVTDTGAVGGTPIPDVSVWVTADSAGLRLVVSGVTDSSGEVVFFLDAGTTYYVWQAKSGYSFPSNGDSLLAE